LICILQVIDPEMRCQLRILVLVRDVSKVY
jgi:hypothetical protein